FRASRRLAADVAHPPGADRPRGGDAHGLGRRGLAVSSWRSRPGVVAGGGWSGELRVREPDLSRAALARHLRRVLRRDRRAAALAAAAALDPRPAQVVARPLST